MSSLGTESLLQKHRQSRKNLRIKIYFLVTVGLFLFRVVWFAANFGSIEHDSGWFLGVAKNLANRGIYASYINTVEVEGAGVYPSLRRGLSIQDEKGFSYFPAGVTVGPGYVFPQALLLKIFGNGYWQYRLWPLITYMGLLFSLFYLVWSLAGMWGLVIFQIWLWAVPQMTTTFAYEGFGEHIALFYLLVGYCLFLKAYQGKRSKVFFFFAGCFFAFAILTKLLFLITLCAFLPVALWEAYTKRNELKRVFWRWISLFAGFVVPVFLFEIYRFASIVPIFGIHLWNILNANTRLEFLYGGSGLHTLGSFNWTFIFQKLMIWPDVGMSDSLAFVFVVAASFCWAGRKTILHTSACDLLWGVAFFFVVHPDFPVWMDSSCLAFIDPGHGAYQWRTWGHPSAQGLELEQRECFLSCGSFSCNCYGGQI